MRETVNGSESGGVIEARLGPVPAGFQREIERMTIVSDSSSVTTFRLYVDRVVPENLRSGSTSGNFDEAEYDPAIELAGGETLILRWTGASAGAVGSSTIQYEDRPRAIVGGKKQEPRPARGAGGW